MQRKNSSPQHSADVEAVSLDGSSDLSAASTSSRDRVLAGVALVVTVLLIPVWWDLRSTLSAGHWPKLDPVSFLRHNMHGEAISLASAPDTVYVQDPSQRARAVLVVLARNEDLDGVLKSMQRLEARFNNRFAYPWAFLTDTNFTDAFRNATTEVASGDTMYGSIPREHWSLPQWLPEPNVTAALEAQQAAWVLYGGKLSYHHMCRYFSGFFFSHPMLQAFDYYWRVEPDVHYYCDLAYDPFLLMQERQLKYGFVISITELEDTIPTLWSTTQEFMTAQPQHVAADNLMEWVTAPDGSYNLCHFWSNFEIGDLNWYRSEAYAAYFDYLDKTNGFYLERWGDAPVHTLAAAMFLNKSEVHFFEDIGYRHNSKQHCPARLRNNCDCDPMVAVQFHAPSYGICHQRWADMQRKRRSLHDRLF